MKSRARFSAFIGKSSLSLKICMVEFSFPLLKHQRFVLRRLKLRSVEKLSRFDLAEIRIENAHDFGFRIDIRFQFAKQFLSVASAIPLP